MEPLDPSGSEEAEKSGADSPDGLSFWTDLRVLLAPGSTPGRPRWLLRPRQGPSRLCLRPVAANPGERFT